MGGKNQTVTTQTSMPAFVTTAYQNLFKRAEPASRRAYVPYPVDRRQAGFNADQNAAFARVRGLGDVFAPYAASAQGLLGQAGSSLDTAGTTAGRMSGDIWRAGQAADAAGSGISGLLPDYTRSLMSPYQDEVVDATMENLLRGNLTEQNALLGRAISSGANPFGGDRAGLAAAELARSQGLARGQVIGELRNTGWQNAMQAGLGALQGDQAARAQQAQLLSGLAGHRAAQAGLYGDIAAQRAGLASQEAGLGSTAFNTQQAAAKAALETGALQQQQAQTGLDLRYKDFLERQNYEKSQIEWLSQVLAGRGDYGNTTTETKPGPSPLNSILGLLTAGIGAFVKDGGRIEGMADGGRMPWDNPAEEEADRNRMLRIDPEAPTIQAPDGAYVPSWENVPSVLPFEIGRGGGHLAAPDDVVQWRQAVAAGASPDEAATAQRAPAVDRPGQPVPTSVEELARLIGLDRVRPSQEAPGLEAPGLEAPGLGAEAAPIEAPAPGLGGFGSRLRRIGDEPWRYGLVMGGLAAAGSESPYPLTALGQGLAAGLGAAMQVREARDTRAAEERARQAQLDAQTEIVTTADGRIWIVHPSTGEKIDTGLNAPPKTTELPGAEVERTAQRELAAKGLKPGDPRYDAEYAGTVQRLQLEREKAGTPPPPAPDDALRGKLDEKTGELWSTYAEQGARAAALNNDLSALELLVDVVPGGVISGNLLKQLPKGFASSADTFQSIVQRLAPQFRLPGSGATSDLEFKAMLASLPDLANSPEANRAIIGILRNKAKIDADRSAVVSLYSAREIDVNEAHTRLREIDARQYQLNGELRALGATPRTEEGAPTEVTKPEAAAGGNPPPAEWPGTPEQWEQLGPERQKAYLAAAGGADG